MILDTDNSLVSLRCNLILRLSYKAEPVHPLLRHLEDWACPQQPALCSAQRRLVRKLVAYPIEKRLGKCGFLLQETTDRGAWSVIITTEGNRKTFPMTNLIAAWFWLRAGERHTVKEQFSQQEEGHGPTRTTPLQPHLKHTEPNTVCWRRVLSWRHHQLSRAHPGF